jgi:hypothetical protein
LILFHFFSLETPFWQFLFSFGFSFDCIGGVVKGFCLTDRCVSVLFGHGFILQLPCQSCIAIDVTLQAVEKERESVLTWKAELFSNLFAVFYLTVFVEGK